MIERRKFPRVEMKQSFLWRGVDTLDNIDVAWDVSEGGIGVAVKNAKLKLKDVIQLEFQLPMGKSVHSKARIQWVNGSATSEEARAGVEFFDISDKNTHDIRCFVGKCRYGCD